jgi:hypothetical protein
MRPLTVILVGATLLMVAGCSSTTSTAAPRLSSHTSTASRTATSPTASVSPVSTDLAACETGRCEVRVSAPAIISFKPGLQLTDLRVVSIKNGVVTIATTSTYSGGSGVASGNAITCSFSGTNETMDNEVGVGCVITNNLLSMTVLSIDGGSAVLRLTPAS